MVHAQPTPGGQRSQAGPSDRPSPRPRALLPTLLGVIGVVFGDIGTSPLYTVKVAGDVRSGAPFGTADLFGVLSLIVWALVLAISIKYVTFVMRADNHGEGGILALLALLPKRARGAGVGVIALLVLAGAALLFGDGMITPAISVLSAIEGLEVANPGFKPYVVPLTCAVLVALFSLQRRGTGSVGKLFGPVMVAWFLTIGALGAIQIVRAPAILGALSPYWGALYFVRHGLRGLPVLGVVVLAITGGEALYADMGHFGPRPIRLSWFALVFPALTLSYLGQGALVLRDPRALADPFFSMIAPGAPTYALVALAAMATTIASQALISGVFSLTHQAVQLGYFPRVTIVHTSREAEGQIYVPLLNWALFAACVALVVGFKHSARLASAYGVAVSGTMAITSVVFFQVARKAWGWSWTRALPLLVFFLSFDLPFVAANLGKIVDGGYIPILVGVAFFSVMLDWRVGRQTLLRATEARARPLEDFLLDLTADVARVPGVAIYLTSNRGVPPLLDLQARRVRSISREVILLSVVIEHQPQVPEDKRFEIERFASGFVRLVIHFGYMEEPNVPPMLARAAPEVGLSSSLDDATFYVGRVTFLTGRGGNMMPLAKSLFALLARNTKGATEHFRLPAERVVELGTVIDLRAEGGRAPPIPLERGPGRAT